MIFFTNASVFHIFRKKLTLFIRLHKIKLHFLRYFALHVIFFHHTRIQSPG